MKKSVLPLLQLVAPLVATLAAILLASPATASITVRDDAGNDVTLARPARRVIAMAPHVTELLFAAGGGAQVVGVMNFSDYPPQAAQLPQVGSAMLIDMERVVALKPDLLVVWKSGNTTRQLEQLKSLGVPLFYSEPRKLDDVASSLLRLGQLLGTEPAAQTAARDYRARIATLAATYAQRAPIRVFYQISDKPLYTLNGEHIVSDVLRLCGARNIFAGLAVIAPAVSTEAVLAEDPEAIIGGNRNPDPAGGIRLWNAYPGMTAIKRGNLVAIDSNLLIRPTPRIADGATALCAQLDAARRRRPVQDGGLKQP